MTTKEKIKIIKKIAKLKKEIKEHKGYARMFADLANDANKELVELKYKLNLDK